MVIARAGRSETSLADLVTLTKPRITVTVLITALVGYYFAAPESSANLVWLLTGTWAIVGGANALNMFWERDTDGLMTRTKGRPLPRGTMAPWVAGSFGLLLSLGSIPVLGFGVNWLTAALAAFANITYVLAYTPLKRRSWTAVIVGAVPGAIPPLLGWTAATGSLSHVGVALFLIMFVWQVPHFHAIALFRQAEYDRAGLVVLPSVSGVRTTLIHITTWSTLLVSISLLPFFLGATTVMYLPVAAVLGLSFVGWALAGFRITHLERWAKSLFGISIPYLILLFIALLATRA